ncbi:hypothetical protein ACLKA6_010786 [Drosophila palustris]
MEEKSHTFNDYVTCPYNKAHKLLRGRLAKHLDRCRRNSGISKELRICPFNKTHRYSEEEFAAHIKVCPDAAATSKTFEAFKTEQPVPRPVLVECEESWDNEPDVPAYNPRAYCEENNIIRTNGLKGQSKAARREFRENERRRFAEKR